MRRQKKEGNHFPHNDKLVQEPEGNEENRKPLKEEILQVINEHFIKMLMDMVK
jgi:hypothetical protein